MSDIRQPHEFEALYRAGGWDGKGSGPGSTEAFTRGFRETFEQLLKNLAIRSVLDIGCGDWQWQQHVKWPAIDYVGFEISATARAKAYRAFRDYTPDAERPDGFRIHEEDAFMRPLWPEADLLLVKDVVHHLTRFRVRRLIERAQLYDYVLWVVDVDTPAPSGSVHFPCNWPGNMMEGSLVYAFDAQMENYPYGPKHAILQKNP